MLQEPCQLQENRASEGHGTERRTLAMDDGVAARRTSDNQACRDEAERQRRLCDTFDYNSISKLFPRGIMMLFPSAPCTPCSKVQSIERKYVDDEFE